MKKIMLLTYHFPVDGQPGESGSAEQVFKRPKVERPRAYLSGTIG